MVTSSVCPACGAPISETAILALAPICTHCHSVLITVGGSLGLTGAFGVGDRDITRARIQADLKVLCDYIENYDGMKEHCKQKLTWTAERYARLPPTPAMLPIETGPRLFACISEAAMASLLWLSIGGQYILDSELFLSLSQ